MRQVTVTVSIDTEEDNWGSFAPSGTTVRNILQLPELQEVFDRWGARPTYLVSYPPLLNALAVDILGSFGQREEVEIGAHCHPWNTPPFSGSGSDPSMMFTFSRETNRAKIREVTTRIASELGVRPTAFRTGRWGFGPTVAEALADEGYAVDASVSPFVDWSSSGGPDFWGAPHSPYRFHPSDPLSPVPDGSMIEMPTTVGFVRANQRSGAKARRWVERKEALARMRLVGLLDRTGILKLRWLSPETSTAREMRRLAYAWVEAGETVLAMTFHSCSLLPGATPFVRTEEDRHRMLRAIDSFLRFCSESGFTFRTLSDAADVIVGRGGVDGGSGG